MTTNLLGLPIEGDITRGQASKPQRPLEEFQAIIKAALEQPGVTEFSWTQYTPYFNDGEPCIFGVHGLGSVTVDGLEIEDWGPYGDEEIAAVGTRPVSWHGTHPDRVRVDGPYSGPNEARYDALEALHRALGGGEFDNVLLDLFGDHAEVKVVVGEAVHVEFYEHD